MARLVFTDALGTATLTNGKPAPGDRLGGWVPMSEPYGDTAFGLGTGARFMFAFRTDYLASFEVRDIPNTEQDIMLRLRTHLLRGGEVTVHTEDADNNSYACTLAEGGGVELDLTDTQLLEYTMTFTRLLNTEQGHMLCLYDVSPTPHS